MKIELNVLENGLDFLNRCIYELEDSASHTPSIKYAALHLNSAVELIFKARLTKDHWAFVFEDLNKASYEKYTTGDFKSITLDTALYRLKYICNINMNEKFDRTILQLKKTRNRIEHFHLNENGHQLESLIYKTLTYLIPFLNSEFKNLYVNQTFQEASNWLHKNSKYLTEREKITNNLLKNNASFKVDCPQCNQENTLDIDEEVCLFCNYSTKIALSHFIENHFYLDTQVFQYKNFDLLKNCPCCLEKSLIVSSDLNICKCLNCKESFVKDRFLECGDCLSVDILDKEGHPKNGEVIEMGYFCYKCLFQDI